MIEFYNRDCLEGMKEYPDNYFGLAIVDPPYQGRDAIGLKNNKKEGSQQAKRKDYHLFENIAPGQEYFDELKRVSKHQIIWGANFFDVHGISGGGICWDKKGTAFGRAEFAYCSKIMSVNVFEYTWNGMIQEDMSDKEIRIHPTQKPVALYKWLLNTYAEPGDIILDTHVGSASSLIACHDLGFDAVGFELDPVFYQKAKQRLEDHQKQISFFDLIKQEE